MMVDSCKDGLLYLIVMQPSDVLKFENEEQPFWWCFNEVRNFKPHTLSWTKNSIFLETYCAVWFFLHATTYHSPLQAFLDHSETAFSISWSNSTACKIWLPCDIAFISLSDTLYIWIQAYRTVPILIVLSLILGQVVAAMCSKVPFLSNAIMKATECGM